MLACAMLLVAGSARGFQTLSRGAVRRVACQGSALVADAETAKRLSKARPSRDDVDRISWGKPSKKKGVGSRGMPHRLNAEEREAYDRAKRAGFVEVGGSAWRAERRDAPLLNTWRNWCDATGMPSIALQKSSTGTADVVLVDLSPLRRPLDFDAVRDELHGSDELARLVAPTQIGDGDDADPPVEEGDEWTARPIHQLPRYELAWASPTRGGAKAFAKDVAAAFGFKAPKASKAPGGGPKRGAPQVKAGKGRRHGGYGI